MNVLDLVREIAVILHRFRINLHRALPTSDFKCSFD